MEGSSTAAYPDGLIPVGSCGTGERRWLFDKCPGWYLRRPDDGHATCLTVDGFSTPFDKAWKAHWRFSAGHPIGTPPPPKLLEAVELIESEMRAREALSMQKIREDNEKQRLRSKYPNAKVIARGK